MGEPKDVRLVIRFLATMGNKGPSCQRSGDGASIKKFAFVVGVGSKAIEKTFHDAEDLSLYFEAIGFAVFPKSKARAHLTAAELLKSFGVFISEREREIKGGAETFTVFFFSGPGVRVNKKQFFLPYKYDGKGGEEREERTKNVAVPLDFFKSKLRGGGQVMYLLNCCGGWDGSVFAPDDSKVDSSQKWHVPLGNIENRKRSPEMFVFSADGGETKKRNTLFSFVLMLTLFYFPYCSKNGDCDFFQTMSLVTKKLGREGFDGELRMVGNFSISSKFGWDSSSLLKLIRGSVLANGEASAMTALEMDFVHAEYATKKYSLIEQREDVPVLQIFEQKLCIPKRFLVGYGKKLKEMGVTTLPSLEAAAEAKEIYREVIPNEVHRKLIHRFLRSIRETPRYRNFSNLRGGPKLQEFERLYLRHFWNDRALCKPRTSSLENWMLATDGECVEPSSGGGMVTLYSEGGNPSALALACISNMLQVGLKIVGMEPTCPAVYFEYDDMPILELRKKLLTALIVWNMRESSKVTKCELYILEKFPDGIKLRNAISHPEGESRQSSPF